MATPGYLASKSLATFSPKVRSTEVYQTTLPSFLDASTSSGVIFSDGGADWAELAQPLAASAVAEPASTRRRVSFLVILRFLLSTPGIVRPANAATPPGPARCPAPAVRSLEARSCRRA